VAPAVSDPAAPPPPHRGLPAADLLHPARIEDVAERLGDLLPRPAVVTEVDQAGDDSLLPGSSTSRSPGPKRCECFQPCSPRAGRPRAPHGSEEFHDERLGRCSSSPTRASSRRVPLNQVVQTHQACRRCGRPPAFAGVERETLLFTGAERLRNWTRLELPVGESQSAEDLDGNAASNRLKSSVPEWRRVATTTFISLPSASRTWGRPARHSDDDDLPLSQCSWRAAMPERILQPVPMN
jgi:hypothetical protein